MPLGPAILFCPADRPERYDKAVAAADAVILDLEDAVAPDKKEAARGFLRESRLDPATTIVRVNPAGTENFERDLLALADTHYRFVMLAKTEHRSDLDALGAYSVIALCESVLGIENSRDIAGADNVVGLMWGGEDLIASLGGRTSRRPDGAYRDAVRYARSRVLFAAAAAGKFAIDTIHLDIPDRAGLEVEAADAAAVGFTATACIHPTQVETIRRAYAPTAEELRWAHAVLEAAKSGEGVFRLEGRMVDEPILRQARRTIESA